MVTVSCNMAGGISNMAGIIGNMGGHLLRAIRWSLIVIWLKPLLGEAGR